MHTVLRKSVKQIYSVVKYVTVVAKFVVSAPTETLGLTLARSIAREIFRQRWLRQGEGNCASLEGSLDRTISMIIEVSRDHPARIALVAR